jgi:sec-independent protein translocase protein TatB
MFDLDAGKLIVIGIVALIAIPSKDLPRVLRQIGQMTGKMRRMASEFQSQFMEALRESELEDIQKELKDLKKDVSAATAPLEQKFDPMSDIRNHVNKAAEIDKLSQPASFPQVEKLPEPAPPESAAKPSPSKGDDT